MGKIIKYRKINGFALPTVLIASIVMLTVLLVAVSSTTAVQVALVSQYYNQLSRSAADAGLAYADSCLDLNSGTPSWSDAKPLTQNTDCSGNQITGFTCSTGSIDPRCSVSLSTGNPVTNSGFSVGLPDLDANGKSTVIRSIGTVRLLKKSDNTVWRTYSQTSTASTVVASPSPLSVSDPANWLAIGTQTWAKANLNVGTMVTRDTAQTNNSILEKYCYINTESNCTTYGGLYQWDEAMQYVTTNGAQGICPTGSHIPTDNDWKILEMQLGMTQAQADAVGWRGTDQGTQLKSGGSSGLNMPLAGYRDAGGSIFGSLASLAFLWSSSESSTSPWNVWNRYLYSGATVGRDTYGKGYGFSVRCVGN